MSSVVITIKSERNYKLEDIPTLYEAAYFFVGELLGDRAIVNNIQIDIKLVKSITSENNTPNWGECYEIKTGSKYLLRIVRDLSFVDMIKTLAHELVHAIQEVKGHLVITENHEWVWKGQNFGVAPYTGTKKDGNLPWEVEAGIKELTLSKKFSKQLFS